MTDQGRAGDFGGEIGSSKLSQKRNDRDADLKPSAATVTTMVQTSLVIRAFGATALIAAGTQSAVAAAETARFLTAPAAVAAQPARLAVQYELKLRIPDGRGLARLLLEAGVSQDDAAAAARLAAGHLGEDIGGCHAKVSVSRTSDDGSFRLERVTLLTQADQTVIERRGGALAVASSVATRRYPRLV